MKHRENITQQGILFVLSMVTNTKVLNYTKKKQPLEPKHWGEKWFCFSLAPAVSINIKLKLTPTPEFPNMNLKPNLLTSQCLISEISLDLISPSKQKFVENLDRQFHSPQQGTGNFSWKFDGWHIFRQARG